MFIKDKPAKSGQYRFKPAGEDARIVTVDVGNDHIWDHDKECMRSLSTWCRPEFGVEWEAVEAIE